jgi:hypothetical protein
MTAGALLGPLRHLAADTIAARHADHGCGCWRLASDGVTAVKEPRGLLIGGIAAGVAGVMVVIQLVRLVPSS